MPLNKNHSARGGCASLPLPMPEPPAPCYDETTSDCLPEVMVQGETLAVEYCFSDGYTTTIASVQPGLAGTATITLSSSSSCFEVADKVKVYGDCARQGCEALDGTYTIVGVDGNVLTVAEDIQGEEVISFITPPAAPGCGVVSSVPLITKMLDMSSCTFAGKVVNRVGAVKRASALRADVSLGSNEVRVCPKGIVKCYDCVSVPQAGILHASVVAVYSELEYDRVILDDKLVSGSLVPNVSAVTQNCLGMSVREGVITEFQFDLSKADCGCVTAFIPAGDQLLDLKPAEALDGIEDTYVRGTSSIEICDDMAKVAGDCEVFELGYYSLSVTCTDPDSQIPYTRVYANGPMDIVASAIPVSCP